MPPKAAHESEQARPGGVAQANGYRALATMFHTINAANWSQQQLGQWCNEMTNGHSSPWEGAIVGDSIARGDYCAPRRRHDRDVLCQQIGDRFNGTSGWPRGTCTMCRMAVCERVVWPPTFNTS